ncbi:MAG TPA: DUF1289 domain-containing protein [Halieaceae bacterium]|nr:DUF1289 domain-containing protein [Halieaceae bacterium]
MLDHPVKTPCIGVCSTGIGDRVCRGCKRFSHEVIDWNSYTLEQKRVVDSRLSGFLSQCVSNKLRVTDKALLQWQLRVQQISYVPDHDEYCGAYSLLKAGAGQIESPKDYGFEVDQHFRGIPLTELREIIDGEFLLLSQAHYDRYMQTPDMFMDQEK